MSKNLSKDRASLCAFTFNDGRQCTLPQSRDDMGLCYFHRQKHIDRIKGKLAGSDISRSLRFDILAACDLNSTFAALFRATAQGHIKPKTAHTLAYLGHLLLQTQQLAKQEVLGVHDSCWNSITQKSLESINPVPEDDPEDLETGLYGPQPADSPTPPEAAPSSCDSTSGDAVEALNYDSAPEAHSATACHAPAYSLNL